MKKIIKIFLLVIISLFFLNNFDLTHGTWVYENYSADSDAQTDYERQQELESNDESIDDSPDAWYDPEDDWEDIDVDWEAEKAAKKAAADKKAVAEYNKWAWAIRNSIIPTHNSIITWWKMEWLAADWSWEIRIWLMTWYFKTAMFSLFYVIAVWVFIFLWVKLVMARWNAEEFKKALMWFVYAVVGIVLVPMAYVLVSFVSWINF